ncbi:GNAT family N-acetyltransferase [Henriciella sp.]|uniref:GNAT family N-acetyltransferase n=1 Tax=Henriciella sp. TaxID=1968823 RepID=UPI00263A2135|nr:GNAT family N-acetyltransferase [Henriciella sp.]
MTKPAPSHVNEWSAIAFKYEDLSATDLDAWRSLCRQHADYDSALLTPEFTYVIAGIRQDVRVVLVRKGDAIKAVLPIHLRPDGLARPLGTPFADYTGPVRTVDCELSLSDMLAAAGIAAFSTNAMPDPWGLMEGPVEPSGKTDSHVIRVDTSNPQDLIEEQRSKHSKRFKNFRRLRNQLEREAGTLRFDWGAPDTATLATLLEYKRAQFRQTGLVDLTSATQSRQMLDAVALSPYAFHTALWLGDTLISGHFGIRVATSFHPWIAAFNPAFRHFSPGNLLLMSVLETMQDMGLETYDLANGHDHYKKYFSNADRPVQPAWATGKGIGALRQKLNRRVWQLVGADADNSATGRLKRRIDQIAVSEFGAVSRLRQFGYAVLARSLPKKVNQNNSAENLPARH